MAASVPGTNSANEIAAGSMAIGRSGASLQ